jgi:hypothetical protein
MSIERKVVIGPKDTDKYIYIDYSVKDNQITLEKDGVEEVPIFEATNMWDKEHAFRVLEVIKKHRKEFDEPEWVDSLTVYEIETKIIKKEVVE